LIDLIAMKLFRAEQEKKLAQQKKEEEDRLRKEEADKKAKEAEEKRKRLEEAEKKRQVMMQAQKDKQAAAGHVTSGDGASRSGATVNHFIPTEKGFEVFGLLSSNFADCQCPGCQT
jgi:hypothetical protein